MKKLIIFMLFIFTVGCDDKRSVLCEAGYTTEFIVINETTREIALFCDLPEEDIAIMSSETGTIYESLETGACDSKNLMLDLFEEGQVIRVSPENYLLDSHPYSMTINGEAVPDAIWLRKHWSFTPGYYSWTYTLTVTDELLAELAAAE
ncbi:MAG: hypothetical protein LBV18_02625 [Alistipes sp.]|jgi:hypothetical protein|nr:hypothetical protein [Alistipes sp.]